MAKPKRRIKQMRVVPKKVKIKTKKAAAKRYKVLGSGKVKCSKANRSHFTGHRSASRQNRLSKGMIIDASNMRNVRRCLPNDL